MFKKKKKEEPKKKVDPVAELELTAQEFDEAKQRVLSATGPVLFKLEYLGSKRSPTELLSILKEHLTFLKEVEVFYKHTVDAFHQANTVTKAFISDIIACDTPDDLPKHTSAVKEYQKLLKMTPHVKQFFKTLKEISRDKRETYWVAKYADKAQTLIVTAHNQNESNWVPKNSAEMMDSSSYDHDYYEEASLVIPHNPVCEYSCDQKVLIQILDTFKAIAELAGSIGDRFSYYSNGKSAFHDLTNEAYRLFEEVDKLSEEKSDFDFVSDNAYGVQENMNQGYLEAFAVDIMQQYQHVFNSMLRNTFKTGTSATESLYGSSVARPAFMNW